MDVKTVCCTAAFIGVSLSLAAGPPKNVTVRSIVLDYAADVAPGLNIQSDGLGDYLNSANLKSQIQAIGDWELDAINPKNATRRIYLDFSQPIAGSAPGGANPTAPPSAMYKFRALAQCSIYGNSLLDFTAGEQKTCPLRIGFTYNGSQWALVMNPYASVNGPFPETNYATVTCIFPATGSSPCSQWKFTPSGTYRREWLGELPERGTAPRDHHLRRTDCRDRSRRLPPVVFDPFGEVNTASAGTRLAWAVLRILKVPRGQRSRRRMSRDRRHETKIQAVESTRSASP